MLKMSFLSIPLAFAVLPFSAHASTWEADTAHSEVGFAVRHMMISDVRGRFNQFKATVDWDDKDPAKSKIDVEIDAASIDTREAKRDEHLRSDDFISATKFPKLTFKSKSIKKEGSGYSVAGDLTIRGVTKPVTLTVTEMTAAIKDPWGKMRRAATATAQINRKDFGVNWNKVMDSGGVVVGDTVKITITTELVEKASGDKS